MDNIAHTLAGVAMAEAGLRRRTGLATATLAIGANLPDVDALIYAVGSGVDALAFRRGWTHGLLAMVLLPFALAGVMLAWDRLVRRRRRPDAEPVDMRWLLVLAAVGIWSHPVLDLLNTYGVRLLMPFSGRWFYGDTLFIVDPWLWGSLGLGIAFSRLLRRREQGAATEGLKDHRHDHATGPARISIAILVAYVVVMAVSAQIARGMVERQATVPSTRVMVAPTPVNPIARAVVRDLDSLYEVGRFRWSRSPRYTPAEQVASGRDSPAVAEAARTSDGAAYLSWSRFPRFTTVPGRDSTLVRITDLRYPGMDWASVEVIVASPDRAPRSPP